jgi:hypothetical protein
VHNLRWPLLGEVPARNRPASATLPGVHTSGRSDARDPAIRIALPVGLPVIRVTLYGLGGEPQATFDLEPGEKLDVQQRPVFTVTRVTIEPVAIQEAFSV